MGENSDFLIWRLKGEINPYSTEIFGLLNSKLNDGKAYLF